MLGLAVGSIYCNFFISDAGVGLVWIMGHSFVFWGAGRADVSLNGRQLGVPREVAMVRWTGVPGMLWSGVLPEIHKYARLDRALDVLVLRIGGEIHAAPDQGYKI